jgi:hypothetical protein
MQGSSRIQDLPIECMWVPSGHGLSCLWIENRIAASVTSSSPEVANEESKTSSGLVSNPRAHAA